MNQADRMRLVEQARAILANNWVGTFTKPAPHLYPHQWSWDSAFIAMGYAHYDQDRAEQELRTLFAAQWTSGLLPHIVFNPQATAYFPGPEAWRTIGKPQIPEQRISGIVQPPVHASAAYLPPRPEQTAGSRFSGGAISPPVRLARLPVPGARSPR